MTPTPQEGEEKKSDFDKAMELAEAGAKLNAQFDPFDPTELQLGTGKHVPEEVERELTEK